MEGAGAGTFAGTQDLEASETLVSAAEPIELDGLVEDYWQGRCGSEIEKDYKYMREHEKRHP